MGKKSSIALEIFKGIPFSEEEIKFINGKFEKIILSKGETLITPNVFINHQYFMYSGCLRSFLIDNVGKEHTIQFAVKDWWITDYIAYFNEEKSVLSVECIQDSVLYKFSREDLEEMYVLYPKVEYFVRKKLERAYASFQRRILDNFSKNAAERYLDFIKRYPNIEQSVKNYHIASYLGITTESLSRIRKSMS